MNKNVILKVENLVTAFNTEAGRVRAVDGVSFVLEKGTTLGIVGESGCGKSVTALSVMGLLPKPSGIIESGVVEFNKENLLSFSPEKLCSIRGKKISMIFQEPMTALNPVHKIGKQIKEMYGIHFPKMPGKEMQQSSIEMLEKVGIADPEKVINNYPHQLSGGMRQRVMIAMALAAEPDILIADEPTTALDVTVQAQILDLIKDLQKEFSMAVVLITHDLGVIAENCDQAVVMYAGKVVERADVKDLFNNPLHPYTKGLLKSIPSLAGKAKTILPTIKGMVPSLTNMPKGCRFCTRCSSAGKICKKQAPMEKIVGDRHYAACHFLTDLPKEGRKKRAEEIVQGAELKAEEPEARVQESEARAEKLKFNAQESEFRVRESESGVEAWESRVDESELQVQYPDKGIQRGDSDIILDVKNLKKYFPVHGGFFLRQQGWIYAVDDVSLNVKKGETLGLVGESGCGKTTLGRCILGLYNLTAGDVVFQGNNTNRLKGRELKALRLKMQMIFQDPFESLNFRHTIREILEEKYIIHNRKKRDISIKISATLEKVGLSKNVLTKFPHEFSGGQRQRLGIARAVTLNPDMIICDEPVSALDVSIQSQILNLLHQLQKEMGLTYLFISHDLAVVRHVSDRIAVMYLGRIVEIADGDTLYNNPSHPYTRALLSAVPVWDTGLVKKRIILHGEVPSPENPPKGCRFHTRCQNARELCKHEEPMLKLVDQSGRQHYAACHFQCVCPDPWPF
ncbi:MAG: ABC transporter ATP-binding protein [Thermodesulfobacteriota bacterium]|nr:ABC transporter ATP-binding protein [Thermodesulfobacteriota bacterium]